MTAQLLNSHPNNLGATHKINGDTLTLDPLLLNPDDNITLKVIYTGAGESMNLDARIVGVSEVTGTDPAREEKATTQKAWNRALALCVLFLVFNTVYGELSKKRYREERNRRLKDLASFKTLLAESGDISHLTDDTILQMYERHLYRKEKS